MMEVIATGECPTCGLQRRGELMNVAHAQWDGKAYAYCARCGALIWLDVTAREVQE